MVSTHPTTGKSRPDDTPGEKRSLSGWPRVCAGVSGEDPRMISIMSYLAWSIALGFRLDKVGGPTELPPG